MTKIALITGASRGLGRTTALNVARKGGDVIITYQSREEDARAVVAEIVAMGRQAIALQLDVSDVSTFKLFAEHLRTALRKTWQHDTFDHLVNNAGHGDMAPIAETTEAQFDKLVNVHFKGVFFLTQALLPLIADGGRIVNLSSGLTRISFPGFSVYSAVKGAVEVLSIYMAKELAALPSIPWRRARSRQTSSAAPSATRRISTRPLRARRPSVVSACLTTSAR
jgi:NAD(P)-dependent dehydrogenase (short-subunit alcohol dehydrogenase family)